MVLIVRIPIYTLVDFFLYPLQAYSLLGREIQLWCDKKLDKKEF